MENITQFISKHYPLVKSASTTTFLEDLFTKTHEKGIKDGKALFTSAQFKSQAQGHYSAHLAGSTLEELKSMRMGKMLDKCMELVDTLMDSVVDIKAQEIDRNLLRAKGLSQNFELTENLMNQVYRDAVLESGREQVRLQLMPLADSTIRKMPSPMKRPKTDIPPDKGTEVAASSKRRAQSELRHLSNANDLFDFSEALAAFTRNAKKARLELGELEKKLFDSFRQTLEAALKNHPVNFKEEPHGPQKSK